MHSMQMLRDLARRSSDSAVQDLGRQRQQHQQAQQRLEQLQQYREEYQRKLDASLNAGLSSSLWRDYQQFLASLDNAIAHQRGQLGEQQAKVENGLQRWQGEQRKLNAYDTLYTRRAQALDQVEARLDQRQSDEMAAQLARLHGSRTL